MFIQLDFFFLDFLFCSNQLKFVQFVYSHIRFMFLFAKLSNFDTLKGNLFAMQNSSMSLVPHVLAKTISHVNSFGYKLSPIKITAFSIF